MTMASEHNEGLRELRGEGRYFGILEEDGGFDNGKEIICRQCRQGGHIQKNCPHMVCSYCGIMDDHNSKDCNITIFCKKCGEKGHYFNHCSLRFESSIYCKLCNSHKHIEKMCPSVWRSYILQDQTGEEDANVKLDMEEFCCYNCGLSGHLGDDCGEYRSSRVPNDDGSAFSGENLSNSLKKLYYQNLNKLNEQQLQSDANLNNHSRSYQQSRQDDYYDYYSHSGNQYPTSHNLPQPTSRMQTLPNLNYSSMNQPYQPNFQQHQQQLQQAMFGNNFNDYQQPVNYYNYNNYGNYENYQKNNNHYDSYSNSYNNSYDAYNSNQKEWSNENNSYNSKRNTNYEDMRYKKRNNKSFQPSRSGTMDEDFKNIEY